MPIRICSVNDLTPSTRRKRSLAVNLPEFLELKAKLANGLKPMEAVEISFPHSDAKGKKYLRHTVKKEVETMIRNLNLKEYEVRSYSSNGQDFVSVANMPPIYDVVNPPKTNKEVHTKTKHAKAS